jgi:type I restriction enzyme M protein
MSLVTERTVKSSRWCDGEDESDFCRQSLPAPQKFPHSAMQWIAPSEKDPLTQTLEKRLWDSADQFRANSGLKAQEYSGPILGIIFLRFAEVRFAQKRAALENAPSSSRRGSRVDEPAAYHADGILYLAPNARFGHLLDLPEAVNIGAKVNEAMRDIEKHNPQIAGILPKTYNLFTSTLLKELLKNISEIPVTAGYDAFGRIYEYFLGAFARTEGQKGGKYEDFTAQLETLNEELETLNAQARALEQTIARNVAEILES